MSIKNYLENSDKINEILFEFPDDAARIIQNLLIEGNIPFEQVLADPKTGVINISSLDNEGNVVVTTIHSKELT